MATTVKQDAVRAYKELSPGGQRRWLLTFQVLLIMTVLLIGCICISFFRNMKDLWVSGNLIRASQSNVLANLDQLWLAIQEHQQRPDLFKRFGLYQGDSIRKRLEDSYYDAAARLLLNPVLASLEKRFISNSGQISAPDALRLYQMIHRREKCDIEEAFFVRWGSEVRNNSEPALDGSGRDIARKHFALLASPKRLAQVPTRTLLPWREEVVLQARDQIGRARGFKDVYAEIIQEANREPITLADILPDEPERLQQLTEQHEATMVGDSKVDGAYSAREFTRVRTAILNWRNHTGHDGCLFDSSSGTVATGSTPDPSPEQPSSSYITAYKEQWKTFLGGAKVKGFGITEAAKRLEILAGDRSPLLAVLAFTSHNTSDIGTNTQKTPNGSSGDDDAKEIAKVFSPVHQLVPPGPERWTGGWWNDTYRHFLVDLKDAMSNVAEQPSNRDARKKARDVSTAAIDAIELLHFPSGTEGVDRTVKDLLKTPFETARAQVPESGSKEIEQLRSAVCKEWDLIRIKFPFTPTSQQDVTEEDLRRMFDPTTGQFLRFSTGGFIQRSGPNDPWQPGPQVIDFVLDPSFLEFMNDVAQMSRNLFLQGKDAQGKDLGFPFTIKAVTTPSDMQITKLQVGGSPGTKSPVSGIWQFSWPGPDPSAGFLLSTANNSYEMPGMWGLYKMIHNNKPDSATGRVELSKIPLPGGGIEQLMQNGSPARVDLTFTGLPNGISGMFVVKGCPRSAVKR